MDRKGNIPADRTSGRDHLALSLRDKLEQLKTIMTGLQPGLIAVSGGLDSRVLYHFAVRWNLDFEAVHIFGPNFALWESATAVARLSTYGRQFHTLNTDVFSHPAVIRNSETRCYACKKQLFSEVWKLADTLSRPQVLDGSQASDNGEFRPGMRALKELGILSPLNKAGLEKSELRELARKCDLPEPDQPSRACMLTRFAYGMTVDRDTLCRLAEAEKVLYDLGLREFRLRVTAPGEYVLQMDATDGEIWNRHEQACRALLKDKGFSSAILKWSYGVSGYYDAAQTGV